MHFAMKHATTAAFLRNKKGRGDKKMIRDGRVRVTSSEEEMLELLNLKMVTSSERAHHAL